MRSAAAAVALLLFAPVLTAFDGGEHRDLSNLALRMAIDEPCKPLLQDPMKAACELLNGPKNETFGDVTAAIDSFTGREKLASSAALDLMRDRKRQLLAHLMALHRNKAHFQGYALADYDGLHAIALETARTKLRDALFAEAAALHFLQDGFAAGHIVTPRAGFKNAVAGSLHDKFNRQGFWVTAFHQLPEPERSFWESLRKEVDRLAAVESVTVCIKENDSAVLASAIQNGAFIKFYGDSELNANAAQKVALLIISAYSIREVLNAYATAPSISLRACYIPRSATVDKNGTADEGSFEGPIGGITVGPVAAGKLRAVNDEPKLPSCEEQGPYILRYAVHEYKDVLSGQGRPPFTESLYEFPAVRLTTLVGTSKSGSSRTSVDLAWVFGAEDPVGTVRIRENGQLTEKTIRDYLTLSAIAAYASYTRGPGYKAFGGHFEYELPTPFRAASFALRGGYRRYTSDEQHFYRFDYGAKAMIGIEILNLTVAAERGRRLRSDRTFARDTFLMAGFEATLSPRWIEKIQFWKARPPCK